MKAPSSLPQAPHLWLDHTTWEVWLTLDATTAYALLAAVGVWLSFSAKYIKSILANVALHAHILHHARRSITDPSELTPLLSARKAEAKKRANVLAKVYKDGGGFRDFVYILHYNEELSQSYRILLGVFIFILSCAMIGFYVLGVLAARIQANGPALLNSQKCGLWIFDRSRGGDEAATRAGIHDLEKETRAAEYAQNCYETPSKFDAIQCNFLYRSKLPFSPPQYSTDCPFQNEICSQNQTVTFISDDIDANELGINSESSPQFRRRTSCTPLSMEYPFIQNQTENGTTTYYYYYGGKPLHHPPLDYTYTTTGDPFDRLAPGYDVYVYKSASKPNARGYWEPRPELTHPKFSVLTLIFVSSQRIFYKRWNDDPIFPADKEVYLPGDRKPWFRNSDPRARPLACINSIDVRLGHSEPWWSLNDPELDTITGPPEFILMFASLRRTEIYNMIEKRLGRGLIASNNVSQFYSEALGDHHWVNEVEHMVATMHARTQINTWSIATGEDSDLEGKDSYTNITPRETYGNLCGMFKFNPSGYASIHFIPLIAIILSFPIFWVLSQKWRGYKRPSESSDETEVAPGALELGSAVGDAPPGQEASPQQDAATQQVAPTQRDAQSQQEASSQHEGPIQQVETGEPSTDRVATTVQAGQESRAPVDDGGPGSPSAPSLPHDDREEPSLGQAQPSEQRAEQGPQQTPERAAPPEMTDDSEDIEWEPTVIEEGAARIGMSIWKLAQWIWQWGKWLLDTLLLTWLIRAYVRTKNWWQGYRDIPAAGAVDDGEEQNLPEPGP